MVFSLDLSQYKTVPVSGLPLTVKRLYYDLVWTWPTMAIAVRPSSMPLGSWDGVVWDGVREAKLQGPQNKHGAIQNKAPASSTEAMRGKAIKWSLGVTIGMWNLTVYARNKVNMRNTKGCIQWQQMTTVCKCALGIPLGKWCVTGHLRWIWVGWWFTPRLWELCVIFLNRTA